MLDLPEGAQPHYKGAFTAQGRLVVANNTYNDDPVTFTLEVDFLGNGSWKPYRSITVPPAGYSFHTFPAGFSAHWIRVRVNAACTATVYFVYT